MQMHGPYLIGKKIGQLQCGCFPCQWIARHSALANCCFARTRARGKLNECIFRSSIKLIGQREHFMIHFHTECNALTGRRRVSSSVARCSWPPLRAHFAHLRSPILHKQTMAVTKVKYVRNGKSKVFNLSCMWSTSLLETVNSAKTVIMFASFLDRYMGRGMKWRHGPTRERAKGKEPQFMANRIFVPGCAKTNGC